jgi:hypothetical protein
MSDPTLTLGRCGTCKHWTENNGWTDPVDASWRDDESDEDHDARQAAMTAKYKLCRGIPHAPDEDDLEGGELPIALTLDASRYKADLWTRAEFGCVLHAPADWAD